MNKRLFQVLDEMNVNDDANKTATLPCCFDLVSANTVKAGGHVTMGVPAQVILKILHSEYKPMLVLLDMKEYERLKAQPVDAAEAKADRYEKALRLIEQMSDPGDYWKAICDMKAIASEALTPKQTTDE